MPFSTLRIACRNLGRNRRRTGLAVGAIALGQFTLVFVNCMMAGSFHAMLDTITGPLLGHIQIHHPGWREERAVEDTVNSCEAVMSSVACVPGVQSVSARLYAAVLAASGEKTDEPATAEPAMIVGVDPKTAALPGGLLDGISEDRLPGSGNVVLGKVLARRLGLETGKQLALIGQDIDAFPASDLYTITGIVGSRVDLVNRLGVIMSLDNASTFLAMRDQTHEIVVQGTDPEQARELANAIKALPPLEGTEVVTWREAVPELAQIMSMKTWLDLIFVAILFVAAAAGVANTAMMSTFERTHEFGMLLAMGTRPGRIVGMILVESVVLGLGGVFVGSIFGGLTVWVTSRTGINYAALAGNGIEEMAFGGVNISYVIHPVFEWRHVVFGVVAVTLTSVIASVWPAMLASRLEPVEAMRQ